MRVYTVDGTLLTAAWGEDPDVAKSGDPYIDAGTTVLPFPTPKITKSADRVLGYRQSWFYRGRHRAIYGRSG